MKKLFLKLSILALKNHVGVFTMTTLYLKGSKRFNP